MPKEDRFFELFNRHAATLVDGAQALNDLLAGGESAAQACQTIAVHESKADDITREALLAVRRTFITPFDRSDIQALVGALDDAIDQMQKTAKAVQLFGVTAFEPAMREMGAIIREAATVPTSGAAAPCHRRERDTVAHQVCGRKRLLGPDLVRRPR